MRKKIFVGCALLISINSQARFPIDKGIRCSCNVSAKKLHEIFKTILNEITLDENYLEAFKFELRKIFNTLNKKSEQVAGQYEAKKKNLMRKSNAWMNESSMTKLKPICIRSIHGSTTRKKNKWKDFCKGALLPPRTLRNTSKVQLEMPKASRPNGIPAILRRK